LLFHPIRTPGHAASMKKTLTALAAALVVVGSTGIAAAFTTAPSSAVAFEGDELWVADYDVALRLAKESGKDILVDFTGSDWCGWCIKLDNEVFSEEAFIAEAPKSFVLCKLDFPNSEEIKAKVPNPERNDELMNKFGVRGFPTILLLTNEEELIAQTGYMAGGSAAYLPHLAEIRTKGMEAITKVRELVAAYEKAPEDKKLAVVERIVAAFVDMKDTPAATRLVPIVESALVLDPKNEKGLKLKALKGLLGAGVASESVVAEAEAMDTENEHGLLEICIDFAMKNVNDEAAAMAALERLEAFVAKGKFVDAALCGNMCAMGSMWFAQFMDLPERALPLARKALELGIEDEQIRTMVEEFIGSQEGESEPAPARG